MNKRTEDINYNLDSFTKGVGEIKYICGNDERRKESRIYNDRIPSQKNNYFTFTLDRTLND